MTKHWGLSLIYFQEFDNFSILFQYQIYILVSLYIHAIKQIRYIYILKPMHLQLIQFTNGPPQEQYYFNTGLTNQVLKQEKASNYIIYYLPCYVRFKVKEITAIKIGDLEGKISGTLLFSFYYGNLDKDILEQFTGDISQREKLILLMFNREQSIELKSTDKGVTYKIDQKNQIIDYVVRHSFTCQLDGEVFFSPFQLIKLYLDITIQSVVLDYQANKGKKIEIKFNCMESDTVVLDHNKNTTFDCYQIASYHLENRFDNKSKHWFKPILEDKIYPKSQLKDEQEDQGIKHFQYAHFQIPMYKYPGINLIQIFVPLWILGLINLFIFFQDRALSGRIASIATLTLAFIAFIPTINNKIAKSNNIKLVQILVYMQALASILCLIQSYLGRDNTEPYDWETDRLFISAVILNLLTVFIVIILFIIYKCSWQKSYQQSKNQNKPKKLDKKDWRSQQCDILFQKYIRNGKINVLI